MVNCNPETVSTDYDTSDRLYFEPLTYEEVMNIYDTEKPDGVIVQFGGQTPLTLALPLKRAGVPIIRHGPAEYRPGGGSQALRQACSTTSTFRRPPTARPPTSKRRVKWPAASATRCWCDPRTCSAAGPW